MAKTKKQSNTKKFVKWFAIGALIGFFTKKNEIELEHVGLNKVIEAREKRAEEEYKKLISIQPLYAAKDPILGHHPESLIKYIMTANQGYNKLIDFLNNIFNYDNEKIINLEKGFGNSDGNNMVIAISGNYDGTIQDLGELKLMADGSNPINYVSATLMFGAANTMDLYSVIAYLWCDLKYVAQVKTNKTFDSIIAQIPMALMQYPEMAY